VVLREAYLEPAKKEEEACPCCEVKEWVRGIALEEDAVAFDLVWRVREDVIELLMQLHEQIINERTAGRDTRTLFAKYDHAADLIVTGDYAAAKTAISSRRVSPTFTAPEGKVVSIEAVRTRGNPPPGHEAEERPEAV